MSNALPEFKLNEVPEELTFRLEHTFSTTPDQIFRAFTDGDLLQRWFGPEGWIVPAETVEIDPRVGGTYKFTMVNAENPEMTSPSNAVFVGLEENRLVEGIETMQTEEGESYFYMRSEFVQVPEGTLLKITQGPLPAEFHGPGGEGWKQSFGKLEKVLGI